MAPPRERHSHLPCCSPRHLVEKPEKFALIITAFGCLFCLISLPIPRWRADNQGMVNFGKVMGTSALEKIGADFDSRTYGLLHVTSNYKQTWKALEQNSCLSKDLDTIAQIAKGSFCLITGGSDCESGPVAHMSVRCTEYQQMTSIGQVTMGFTIVAAFLSTGGLVAGFMFKTEKIGGVAFGLQIFSALIMVIFNLVWAVTTDGSFKNIMASAWFPYPTLAVGYYMHLFGALFILTGTIFYGIIVLPSVSSYDPLQRAIDRRENRLMNRKVALEKQQWEQQQQQQNQGFMVQQQIAPVGVMMPQSAYGQGQPQMGMGMQVHSNMQVQQMPVQQMQVTTFGAQQQTQQGGGYSMPPAPPGASPAF